MRAKPRRRSTHRFPPTPRPSRTSRCVPKLTPRSMSTPSMSNSEIALIHMMYSARCHMGGFCIKKIISAVFHSALKVHPPVFVYKCAGSATRSVPVSGMEKTPGVRLRRGASVSVQLAVHPPDQQCEPAEQHTELAKTVPVFLTSLDDIRHDYRTFGRFG